MSQLWMMKNSRFLTPRINHLFASCKLNHKTHIKWTIHMYIYMSTIQSVRWSRPGVVWNLNTFPAWAKPWKMILIMGSKVSAKLILDTDVSDTKSEWLFLDVDGSFTSPFMSPTSRQQHVHFKINVYILKSQIGTSRWNPCTKFKNSKKIISQSLNLFILVLICKQLMNKQMTLNDSAGYKTIYSFTF